jgi:hypothetical protein
MKSTTQRGTRQASSGHREYRWIDKDPVCDVLRTIISDDGRSPTAIAQAARLTDQTVLNILYGQTRKPRATTVALLFMALGYSLTAIKPGSPSIILPVYEREQEK